LRRKGSKKKEGRVAIHKPIKTKRIFLLSFLFIAILTLLSFDTRYYLGGDNIRYIILAKSIISGQGYRDINEPSSPPHTTYPPGFPLLLIPFLLLFGLSYPLLNLLPLILALFSLFLFFLILKGASEKEELRLISFSLLGTSPIFLLYSHTLLSEIPFLFFTLLTFYLFSQSEKKKSPFLLIASFLSLTFSLFIRTAGIGILPAFSLYLLLKKRYRELITLLILFLLFFLPYFLYNRHLGRGSGYLELFTYKNPYNPEEGKIGLTTYLSRFGKNFYLYSFFVFPQMLFPFTLPSPFRFLVGLFSLLLLIISFRKRLKAKDSLYPFYLFFSFFILFSWPEVWTGDRFLLPLFPFLLYYLFLGFDSLFPKRGSLLYLFFGIIALGYLIKDFQGVGENIGINLSRLKGDRYAGYPLDWVRYFQACEWIKEHTERDAVIVARKPEFVYFLTERKSFLYPFTTDPKKIMAKIEEREATHLLFDQFFWTQTSSRYLTPLLNEFSNRFEPIYSTDYPQMIVYQIKR